MPTYVYKVKNSDFTFEYKQSIKEEPLKYLPKDIQGYDAKNPVEVERVLTSNVNFIFNGTGFYNTDYKSSNKGNSNSCESPSSCACAVN
jgi:predicted nucleic acid-binding Zn ribbon protein